MRPPFRMRFGTFPQERTENRRFAEDRNGVGNERRLSCSLSSFDGTDRDSFEAGNDFLRRHRFCPARIGQVHLKAHGHWTTGAHIKDV